MPLTFKQGMQELIRDPRQYNAIRMILGLPMELS